MSPNEVRALDDEQLVAELKSLREKLFMLRSQTVTDKVSDNSSFRKVRADIARVLTEQNARRLAAGRA